MVRADVRLPIQVFLMRPLSSGRIWVHLEQEMTKLKFITQVSGVALALCMVSGTSFAQSQLTRAVRTASQSTASGAAAQARINQLDDENDTIVGEYRAAIQEEETVALSVEQQKILLRSQRAEIESIRSQIDRVDEVQSQLLPMMLRMIGALEAFVENDIPFQLEERRERIQKIKDVMQNPSQSPSERYRQIMNAYRIEMAYGQQNKTYTEDLMIDGRLQKVDFLRIGRVSLIYKGQDGAMHIWSKAKGAYEDLSSSHAMDYSTAVRIASEQKTPEIFSIALPGATKANR